MAKEMLINTVEGQECRIAIVSDGLLEELYIERASSASHVGNIYKGRITNVEPAIQASFVDFGLPRNGFLHISDLSPQYYQKGKRTNESVGRKRSRRERPPIQDCLRRGQEVVVQLTKEGIGTKGPTLTTYLSIPGKLIVMMPGMIRLGVSRKIEDEKVRAEARKALSDLSLPSDKGFILRTAGVTSNKRDLRRDLTYLLRLWKAVEERIKTSKAPAEIYQESDLVTRTIRDIYNADVNRIICDNVSVGRKVKEFLDVAMPRTKHVVELYVGKEGLFHEYGLEHEIERIYSRQVELPSGGSIVIDQTEALVAIDVNSGRFRDHVDAEQTALKMNQEAAREIARQLRLRDLGGVIITDFIDMRDPKNRRAVEKTLREAMKDDRAKVKILRMSSFCMVEMTRQRVRPSLRDSIYTRCEHCRGIGLLKSKESLALQVMRILQRLTSRDELSHIDVRINPAIADYLSNYERSQIAHLESTTQKRIHIVSDVDMSGDAVNIVCTDHRGSTISWDQGPPPRPQSVKVEAIPVEGISHEQVSAPPAPAKAPVETQKEPIKTPKKPRRKTQKKRKTSEKKEEASVSQKTEQPTEAVPKAGQKKKTRRGRRRQKKKSTE